MADARTITAAVSIAVAAGAVGFAARTPSAAIATSPGVSLPTPPRPHVVACHAAKGALCDPNPCEPGEALTACWDTDENGGADCYCQWVPSRDGGSP